MKLAETAEYCMTRCIPKRQAAFRPDVTAVGMAAPYAVQESICCLMMAEVWTCYMSWRFLSIPTKHRSSLASTRPESIPSRSRCSVWLFALLCFGAASHAWYCLTIEYAHWWIINLLQVVSRLSQPCSNDNFIDYLSAVRTLHMYSPLGLWLSYRLDFACYPELRQPRKMPWEIQYIFMEDRCNEEPP